MPAAENHLKKGTPVIISGLQSAKGKKLNGGLGIILSGAITADEGVVRYPVLIYALPKDAEEEEEEEGDAAAEGGFKILEETVSNKLKVQNLNVDSDESTEKKKIFHTASRKNMYKAQDAEDWKMAMFWKSFCYHQFPNDYEMGISYASQLHRIGKFQEAYDVVKLYAKNPDQIRGVKNYNIYCYDFCLMYTSAGKDLEEALDYALQIPPEDVYQRAENEGNDQPKTRAEDAMAHVLDACNKKVQEARGQDKEMLSFYLQTSKLAFEKYPDNVWNMNHLAAANCMLDNNLDGAKMYRRALASGLLPDDKISQIKESLVLAQMQCPGMPMDASRYYVISGDSSHAYIIDRADMGKVVLTHVGGRLRVTARPGYTGPQPNLITAPVPSDPDDPDVFPAEFLARLTE